LLPEVELLGQEQALFFFIEHFDLDFFLF